MQTLGLDGDHDIKTAVVSRFSALETCARNDVVLIKEDARFRAGKVKLHCEVDGEALSLVSMFTLQQHVAAAGYAVWKVSEDGAALMQTNRILHSAVYSNWPGDLVCTLLPMEFR